jgi:hypothetical protein
MHQTELPSGQLIDLGPNWIHGTDHNPILDLAKETNTLSLALGEGFNAYDEDGHILEDGKELNGEAWDIISKAFEHSKQNTSTIDPEESLHDFFAEKVKEIFPDATNHANQRKIVMQMSEMWGPYIGSPVRKQSLKFFWLEECIEGGTLFTQLYYCSLSLLRALEILLQ